MKNFKSILLGLSLMTASAMVVLTSCDPDPCKDVVCNNGGLCNTKGECECPVGFEGKNCDVKSNSVFVGTNIQGDDNCVTNPSGQSYDHTATFTADASVAKSLNITGFADYTCIPAGTTIPQPLVVPTTIDKGNVTINFTGCTYTITGTGTFTPASGTAPSKLTIDYVAKYPGTTGIITDACKVTYTK